MFNRKHKAALGLLIYIAAATALSGCALFQENMPEEPALNQEIPAFSTKISGAAIITPEAISTQAAIDEQKPADEKEPPKAESVPIDKLVQETVPTLQGASAERPNDDKEKRNQFFEDTLFIGDSRTEGFMLYAGVNNASYFCGKGIAVDEIVEGQTLNVKGEKISVYDALAKRTYDKVYISVGLNELGWYSIETFKDCYRELIDAVRESQPDAKIFLQAVLPVTAELSEKDQKNNNKQIYWYNVNIIEIAGEKGVYYVNAASAVSDNTGCLSPEATTDGIHMNKEFCIKWADYLASKPGGEE